MNNKVIRLLKPVLGTFLLASCSASPNNLDAIKEQLRAEIREDLQNPSASPSTIVLPPEPTPTPFAFAENTLDAVTDAIDALYAINSKTEAGISYANYSSEFGNLKVIVDKMNRQDDIERHPSHADINSSLKEYEFAKSIWQCYIEDSDSTNNFLGGTCQIAYTSILRDRYDVEVTRLINRETIYLPQGLQAVWEQATSHLKMADEKKDGKALETRSAGVSRPAVTPSAQPIASVTPVASAAPAQVQTEFDIAALELKWVDIPAGRFSMGRDPNGTKASGSVEPVHDVIISRSFGMTATEVTQKQWRLVMGSNPSHHQGDNLPVENISYKDVQAFIARLNSKNQGVYRLPTEAEWEYAARAKTTDNFFFGKGLTNDSLALMDEYAWHGDNTKTTQPVGQKKPNPFGLYDIYGNVAELVSDWYGDYGSETLTDPQGPVFGSVRVTRGGSFFEKRTDFLRFPCCDSVSRGSYVKEESKTTDIGFRLVKK